MECLPWLPNFVAGVVVEELSHCGLVIRYCKFILATLHGLGLTPLGLTENPALSILLVVGANSPRRDSLSPLPHAAAGEFTPILSSLS